MHTVPSNVYVASVMRVGEMAKWILKLPKHFSNTAAVTVLDWPAMRATLLVRKLSFLKRVAEAQADTLVVEKCESILRWTGHSLPSKGM